MTNREKINAMDNHELVKTLNRIGCSFCIFEGESHCSSKCLEGVEQMDRMAKWKPEVGERYLYPCIYGCKVSYDIDIWENRPIDEERYKVGIICKDRYEVGALAMKMLAVAKERVEND